VFADPVRSLRVLAVERKQRRGEAERERNERKDLDLGLVQTYKRCGGRPGDEVVRKNEEEEKTPLEG
jgi:hypothetical protein